MNTKALHRISYGLYIISSKKGDRLNGQMANALVQISNDPVSIAVSINKENLTHEFIDDSGFLTVSVLDQETPLSLIGAFGFTSGRDADKYADVAHKLSADGVPYLADDNGLAYLAARVAARMDANTHTVFLCEVSEAEVLREGTPMTYAHYHQVKRGTTPKRAPLPPVTGETNDASERRDTMDKYECTICGYIYDPEVGDPDNGVEPGTAFDALADDWTCPICGAGKDAFEKVD